MSLDNAGDASSTLVRECIENESLARDLLARTIEATSNEIVQRCKAALDGSPGSYLALLGCIKQDSAATNETSQTKTDANSPQKSENSASAPTAPLPHGSGNVAGDSAPAKVGTFRFTHDLKLGMVDPEVKELQIFLNTHGYPIAASGQGSPGLEVEKFGSGTKAALEKFQEAHAKEIGVAEANGRFGPATRKYMNGM